MRKRQTTQWKNGEKIRTIQKKETETVNKCKKTCLTSLLIKEMQIKKQRFHFTSIRLAKIGKFDTSVGEVAGKCQLSDTTIWQYLQKLEICMSSDQQFCS